MSVVKWREGQFIDKMKKVFMVILIFTAVQKIESDNIKVDDIKVKAKILQGILKEVALKEGVELGKKKRQLK